MSKITVQLLRGIEVQFSELIQVFYQIGSQNIASMDDLNTYVNLASGGKLRSYIALLRKYKLLRKKGYKLTELGQVIYENDMDINNEETLWLLHYIIVSPTENLVFNELFGNIFHLKEKVELENIKEYFEKYDLPVETLKTKIRKEVRAGMKLYVKERFQRLGMVEGENIDGLKTIYFINKNTLESENVLLLLLYYFKENYRENASTIEIKDICYGQNSPGIFCLLDEYNIREMLEKLHIEKKISIESRADLDQIRFIGSKTSQDIFKEVL